MCEWYGTAGGGGLAQECALSGMGPNGRLRRSWDPRGSSAKAGPGDPEFVDRCRLDFSALGCESVRVRGECARLRRGEVLDELLPFSTFFDLAVTPPVRSAARPLDLRFRWHSLLFRGVLIHVRVSEFSQRIKVFIDPAKVPGFGCGGKGNQRVSATLRFNCGAAQAVRGSPCPATSVLHFFAVAPGEFQTEVGQVFAPRSGNTSLPGAMWCRPWITWSGCPCPRPCQIRRGRPCQAPSSPPGRGHIGGRRCCRDVETGGLARSGGISG